MEYAQSIVNRYKELDCIVSIEDTEDKINNMENFRYEVEKDLERIKSKRMNQFICGLWNPKYI